ncbi:hypothetical protein ARMGADRAFT_1133658 [Armillaria gallica]|uniref:Uncharacterized protein n=1 Tax=Armillaria gallica TaxID=47427 RepID=A0A2H3D8S6_ARMGA|nr:hypothetical protein ARMGADRAFT_1133658 [Armillaria gallica]
MSLRKKLTRVRGGRRVLCGCATVVERRLTKHFAFFPDYSRLEIPYVFSTLHFSSSQAKTTMDSAFGLASAVSTARKDSSAFARMLSLVSHRLRTKQIPQGLRSSLEAPTVTARVLVDSLDGLRAALQWESKQDSHGCGNRKPSKPYGMLKERVMGYWSVTWKRSSFLVEEIIAKEPLSVEGTEFQHWTLEVVAEFLRLAAFETQGCPNEFEVLKAPGFLSTLVKLWFHALGHGGSPAALRDTAFSLILFDSINFSTLDGFKEVLDQVDDVLKDTPDAVTICCTHIFDVI